MMASGKRDLNQLAKSIVEQTTGESPKARKQPKRANGGKTRMSAMTPEQRQELAQQAAIARWKGAAPVSKTGAAKVSKKVS